MKCSICESKLTTPAEEAMTACTKCAAKLGIVPMPEVTRPPTPCGKCNGLAFIRVIPREQTTTPGEYGTQNAEPMFATYKPAVHNGWFSKSAKPLDAAHGAGMLEMFVCEGCGFVEWYIPDVKEIPVSPLANTQRVDYGSKGGPHR